MVSEKECVLTEGTWNSVRGRMHVLTERTCVWKQCMRKVVCFQWRKFKQRKNVYFIWRNLKRCQRKSVCLTEGTCSSVREGTELKHMPEETRARNVCKVLVPVRRENWWRKVCDWFIERFKASASRSASSTVSTPLQWIFKTRYKMLFTHAKSHASAVSLLESGE